MFHSQAPEPSPLSSTLRRLIGRSHPAFDNVVAALRAETRAEVGLLSLRDGDQQRVAAHSGGVAALTSNDRFAFYTYVMAQDGPLVVGDASDDWRFRYNPLVLCEPFIRAYVGQALRIGGRPVGTLCATGRTPGAFAGFDTAILSALAAQAEQVLRAEIALPASPRTGQQDRDMSPQALP